MRALAIWRISGKFRVGFGTLVFLVVLVALHPWLIALIGHGTNPLEEGAYNVFSPPSTTHILGTDRFGRDVLALVLAGLPNTMLVALIAGVVSTVVGVIVGFVAGYEGGKTDSVLRTVTDMFLVIPTLPLLLALAAYSKHVSLPEVSLMLSIFSWPFAARTIRSQVLSLRDRPYVELARLSKESDLRIIFKQLVPNLLPYIGFGFTSAALGAVFALVGLEVIGLGPSNALDLGLLVNLSISWGVLTLGAWPIFVAPIVLLVLLFLCLNLMNVGLEEFFNPRLRRLTED